MKKIAIVQSNYIPWKGYFDLIAHVDEFILYDDMQFTKRDWRNRNLIKTPNGTQWLTVPVKVKGKFVQKIKETEIQNTNWNELHWKTIHQYYSKSACYKDISSLFEEYYFNTYDLLSDLNRSLILAVCNYLDIDTKISNSWDYGIIDGKTERLVDLCLKSGATEYVSGPSAKNYIDEDKFESNGLILSWYNYNNYSTYPQLWGEFTHNVSIIDLLFNCGKNSKTYMKFSKS